MADFVYSQCFFVFAMYRVDYAVDKSYNVCMVATRAATNI